MCNLRHVQENDYSDRKIEKTQTQAIEKNLNGQCNVKNSAVS